MLPMLETTNKQNHQRVVVVRLFGYTCTQGTSLHPYIHRRQSKAIHPPKACYGKKELKCCRRAIQSAKSQKSLTPHKSSHHKTGNNPLHTLYFPEFEFGGRVNETRVGMDTFV